MHVLCYRLVYRKTQNLVLNLFTCQDHATKNLSVVQVNVGEGVINSMVMITTNTYKLLC